MYLNDYIKMNNLDFNKLKFNDLDALVLTQFIYTSIELVDTINIDSTFYVKDLLVFNNSEKLYENIFIKQSSLEMFRLLLTSIRYNNIPMKHYCNVYDKEKNIQFSAITYEVPNTDIVFVAFRGTDLSVSGWFEDFNMALTDTVPAQDLARRYLDYIIKLYEGKEIYVSGHSKGGNLAIYACMHALNQSAITKIYDFDGQGFKDDIYATDEFKFIEPKITKIVPRTAIVGLLMNNNRNYKVVESKAIGAMQHDPFSWEIRNRSFVYALGIDLSSKLMNDLMTMTLDKFDEKKRNEIIKNFQNVIENAGVINLKDVSSRWLKVATEAINAIKDIPNDRKKDYQDIIKEFIPIAYKETKESKNKCFNCKKNLELSFKNGRAYYHCPNCGKTYVEVSEDELN